MADIDTVPRSYSPERAPIPAMKSTLPMCMTDPLLALTPEKNAKPLFHNVRSTTHNAKPTAHKAKPTTHNPGCVRVERHGASNVQSVTETNNSCTTKQRATNKRTNISTKQTLASHQVASQVAPKTTTTRAAVHKNKRNANNNKKMGAKINNKGIASEETPSPLAQPQCHSSAAVGRHLESLQRETFDGENAVLSTLQQSESTRIAFAEKVAEGVNRPVEERKYSGLIAVDVPIEDTLAQGERPMNKVRTTSSKISEGPVPDILDLFTPDMIVEQPSFDLSTLKLQEDVKLEHAPPDMAFNLYKHMRCWESS